MNTEDIDRGEIPRYLGYGRYEAGQVVMGLVEEYIAQLLEEAQPRRLYKKYPLILGPEDAVDGGCFRTVSRNLSRNLRGYGQIIVFAATLGMGAGRLIQKYNKLQIGKAVTMWATAMAMIEEYCDQVCASIREEYESEDRYLRSRFSPGYGGFPLGCQQRLLDNPETGKRVGIKLTDNLLMMPPKSVIVVMEVSKKPYRCDVKGYESCERRNCLYRR